MNISVMIKITYKSRLKQLFEAYVFQRFKFNKSGFLTPGSFTAFQTSTKNFTNPRIFTHR